MCHGRCADRYANDHVFAVMHDLEIVASRHFCQRESVARVDDRSSTAPLQWSRRGWGWQRAHSEIDTGAETAPVGNCAQDQRGNSSQCDTINALEAFGNRRTTTRAATGPSREKKSKKRTEVKRGGKTLSRPLGRSEHRRRRTSKHLGDQS